MATPNKTSVQTYKENVPATSAKKSRLPVLVKACESLKKGIKRHLSPSVGERDVKRCVLPRDGKASQKKEVGRQQKDGSRKVLVELPREQRKIQKARRTLQVTSKQSKPAQVTATKIAPPVKQSDENTPPSSSVDSDFGFKKDDQALQSILDDTGIQAGISKPSTGPGRASTLSKCTGTPGRVRHTLAGEPSKTPSKPTFGMRESIGVRTFRKLCDDFMNKQTHQSKKLCTDTKSATGEAGYQFCPKMTPSRVSFIDKGTVPTFTAGSKEGIAAAKANKKLPRREQIVDMGSRASLPATMRPMPGVPNPFSVAQRQSMYVQTPSRVKRNEGPSLDPLKETVSTPQAPVRILKEHQQDGTGSSKNEASIPFQTPARMSSIYMQGNRPSAADRRLSLANQTPGRVPRKDQDTGRSPINPGRQSLSAASPAVHTPRRGQRLPMTPQGQGQVGLSRCQGPFTPLGRVQTMDIRLMGSPGVSVWSPGYGTPKSIGASLREPTTPKGQGTPQGQTRDLRLMWRTKKTPNKTPVKKEILGTVVGEGILKSPQPPLTPLGHSLTPGKTKKKNITWADALESYRHTDTDQSRAKSSEDIESFDTNGKNVQFSSADAPEAREGATGPGSCSGDVIGYGKQGQHDESSVPVTGELESWPQQQASNPISHDAMQDEPSRESSLSSQSLDPSTTHNAPSISDISATIGLDTSVASSSTMGIKVGGSVGLKEPILMAPYSVPPAGTQAVAVSQRQQLTQQSTMPLGQQGDQENVMGSQGNTNILGPSLSLCANHQVGLRGQGRCVQNINIVMGDELQHSDNVNRNHSVAGEKGLGDVSVPKVVDGDDNYISKDTSKSVTTAGLLNQTQGLLTHQPNDVDVNSNFLPSVHTAAQERQQQTVQLEEGNANICDDEPKSPSCLRKNDNDNDSVMTMKTTSTSEQLKNKSVREITTPPPNKRASAFRSMSEKSGLTPKVGSLSLRANLELRKKSLKGPCMNVSLKLAMTESYLEALLDNEVEMLTHTLVGERSIGCHTDRCLNPIAKMLLNGDSMHFVPIEAAESPRYIDMNIKGSAFTRYISRAT